MTLRVTLRHDQHGASIIEMALLLPIAMVLLMGLCEICYEQYIQSVLDGAVADGGRKSAIEGSDRATIDKTVLQQIAAVAPSFTYKITRKTYPTFSDIGKSEQFDDRNGNGVRDPGECFTDLNGNGTWDAEIGLDSQGGGDDVTIYKVAITYDQVFPLAALIGGGTTRTQSAQTTLKNQPYQAQVVPTATTVCK